MVRPMNGSLPLPPGERVGVRGTHGVALLAMQTAAPPHYSTQCLPLTLTLSPGGRGDSFPLPRITRC